MIIIAKTEVDAVGRGEHLLGTIRCGPLHARKDVA